MYIIYVYQAQDIFYLQIILIAINMIKHQNIKI